MSPQTTRYLLLDGVKIENLPRHLYTLEDSPVFEWLYHGTRYHALCPIGPALVVLRPGGALEQSFLKQWQHDAGLMLESDEPIQPLADHLRSMIHARAPGDAVLLFRYYDPRVMRHWLPDLDSEEKDHLMGPVNRVRLPAWADLQERWIIRDQQRHSAPLYAERPWLYLDEQQLQKLNQGKLERLDETLLAHVHACFPDCLSLKSVAEQMAWAATCRQSAGRHGFSTMGEVMRWAALIAIHGTEFPQGHEHQAYMEILKQRSLTPVQRMDALIAELHRHLQRNEEESFT